VNPLAQKGGGGYLSNSLKTSKCALSIIRSIQTDKPFESLGGIPYLYYSYFRVLLFTMAEMIPVELIG